MNIVQWIKQQSWQIDCQTLSEANEWAAYFAVATSDVGGVYADTAWLAVQVAMNAAWFVSGCQDQPPEWPDDPQWDPDQKCQKVRAPGTGWYTQHEGDGGQTFHEFTPENTCLEIVKFESADFGGWTITYVLADGNSSTATIYNQGKYIYPWIKPQKNSYCIDQAPTRPPPPDEPIGPTIDVPELDEDEPDCRWTIEPVNTHVDAQGTYWTRYFVTNNDPDRCGSSFYYWSSQRGPTFCPPNGDCPAPDGGGGSTYTEPILTGTTYYLDGLCENPEEWGMEPGEWVTFEWNIEQANASLAIARRVDALAEIVNMSGWMKKATCAPEKVELKGDWVTTRWLSDEKMDHSGRRLRKLFRYRSQSSRDLGQLSSYWEDFSWTAGPVCVRHKGAWWGDPQVWASSAGEGKRVIRHAAAEAGIDPDQDGEWAVSGSRSPRYGMSGTMRIQRHKGFPWVASRDGADWPNLLARELPE